MIVDTYVIQRTWKDIRFSVQNQDKIKNYKMNKIFKACVGDFDGGVGFTQYNSILIRVLKFEDDKIMEKIDGSYNIPEEWVEFGSQLTIPGY